MKTATNIILLAIALYLSVEVLSKIDKSKVDGIKNTFTSEQTMDYILIPKRYDIIDTIRIYGIQRVQDCPLPGRFGITQYKAFISNNEILHMIDMEEYELVQAHGQ